jgi:glycosyltransferase involved in cell wall biosynthesis
MPLSVSPHPEGPSLSARRSPHPLVVQAYQNTTRRLATLRLRGSAPARDLDSIAVVGALRRNNGISRGAVLQHEALRREGYDARLVDATAALRNPAASTAHQPASTYIFHIGVPDTVQLIHGVLPAARHAWRIGYWAWELPTPPPGWKRVEPLVSEIWAPSHFTATAFRSLFDLPVRVVPHTLMPSPARYRDPSAPFTVLAMADSRSSFTRKNPAGAIEAFHRAFGHSPHARLIVKINGTISSDDPVVRAARQAPNVEVRVAFLDDEAMRELYRSADVLLSLHRAEGFGLPMLEAMAHGVPVVATGWSGSTDFMTAENSMVVPFDLVPVRDAAGIYVGGDWAEPDLDAAAAALRTLAFDESRYDEIARAAHRYVEARAAGSIMDHMGLGRSGPRTSGPADRAPSNSA